MLMRDVVKACTRQAMGFVPGLLIRKLPWRTARSRRSGAGNTSRSSTAVESRMCNVTGPSGSSATHRPCKLATVTARSDKRTTP